jgi:hypothetical protein
MIKQTIFFILVSFIFLGCSPINQTTSNINNGSISGIVKWPGRSGDTGLPLYSANETTVTLYSGDNIVSTLTTSLEGGFCFSNIIPGNYKLLFKHSECSDVTLNTQVNANAVTTVSTNNFNCVLIKPNMVKKPWTILYYVNATDSTQVAADRQNIRFLEKIGSGANLNIAVLFFDDSTGSTRFYYLKKQDFTVSPDYPDPDDPYISPNIFSPNYDYSSWLKSYDPGKPAVLENFISSSMDLYPADNYMVIISGHGTGIDETNGYNAASAESSIISPIQKSVSPTVVNKTEIRIPELRNLLERVTNKHPISILAFEACLMGMFEVAYELKDTKISYLVASEATVGKSLNYSSGFVDKISKGTLSAPLDIANAIVSGYNSAGYVGNTLAAFDLSKINVTVNYYNSLAASLKNYGPITDIKTILKSCQNARGESGTNLLKLYETYYDLRHFCQLIKDSSTISDSNLKLNAANLYNNLAAGTGNFITVFSKDTSAETQYPNAAGLSTMIYDPAIMAETHYAASARAIYKKLKYYTDGNTDWDNFLIKVAP